MDRIRPYIIIRYILFLIEYLLYVWKCPRQVKSKVSCFTLHQGLLISAMPKARKVHGLRLCLTLRSFDARQCPWQVKSPSVKALTYMFFLSTHFAIQYIFAFVPPVSTNGTSIDITLLDLLVGPELGSAIGYLHLRK